jgi:Flp pilus assembly CpaF family ATPase
MASISLGEYEFSNLETVDDIKLEVSKRVSLFEEKLMTVEDRKEMTYQVISDILKERAANMLSAGFPMPTLEEDNVLTQAIISSMFGMGNLQSYLEDEQIENIDINGPDDVWLTYANGKKIRAGKIAESDEDLIDSIRAIATRAGLAERRFDSACPELDIRLPDGSRLSALMEVCKHPVISIRKHRFVDITLQDEIKLGLLDEFCASLLSACVKSGKNIIIAGRTNSGKTTLLRALANEIPPAERIITIEQSLELGINELTQRHPDCIALEARLPNAEGIGEISMADLVRRSLRMNPDRVIVGETLGPEIVALLNAMSQGFGSLATIHSDSSFGVFNRIASYAAQSAERLPMEATNLLIASSIDFVVYVALSVDPISQKIKRYVTSVREVVGAEGNMVVSNEIIKFSKDFGIQVGSPVSSGMMSDLMDHGFKPNAKEL